MGGRFTGGNSLNGPAVRRSLRIAPHGL